MSEKDPRKPKPAEIPEPTYWPFLLAFGVTFLVWGIVTSWIISAVGLIVFIIALAGWMSDLYHELKNTDQE